MPTALGLDVYGTLVDPLAISGELRRWFGDRAGEVAALWRRKQVEYAFRKALMRRYEDFSACSRQALEFACLQFGVRLSDEDRRDLLGKNQELPAFSDVATALERLRKEGHTVVAFSNGPEAAVRPTLDRAGLIDHLHGVVSVDDVRTFKPDPAAYAHLLGRLGRPAGETWLVSGNAWDVLGAKSAGLRAAWVRREPDKVFDPWGIEPDLIVAGLGELADRLG